MIAAFVDLESAVPAKRFNLNDQRFRFAFLIQELARAMRRAFLERAAKTGLTQMQARALAAISLHEGSAQVELARRLDIHPMTFVRLLDRMERSGLIERRRDPDDRRVFNVFLAPKAEAAIEHLTAASEDLREIALDGFAATEHDLFLRYLERLKVNVGNFARAAESRRSLGQRRGAA